MTIETANRLLQYRKKAGYSQEELAEKIGVSRQAVSKWERSEASPDTDNLVMLSKLYGVSLDEMLGLESENKQEIDDEVEKFSEDKEKDEVHVSIKDGIHINTQEGDKVDISFKEGIHVVSKGDDKAHVCGGEARVYDEDGTEHKFSTMACFWTYIPFPVIIAVVYLFWGFSGIWGGWSLNWLIFFTIPIYYTLIESIKSRDASKFAFPVLAAGLYVTVGMLWNIWHPTWIVFLLIPVYYGVVETMKAGKSKHKKENKCDDNN